MSARAEIKWAHQIRVDFFSLRMNPVNRLSVHVILSSVGYGRSTAASSETVQDLFRDGRPLEEIADAANVSLDTVKSWLSRGEKGHGEPYETIYSLYVMSGSLPPESQSRRSTSPPPVELLSAREPILTHELIDEIVRLTSLGLHLPIIARRIRVPVQTLVYWLQEGKRELDDPSVTKSYQDLPPYWPLYVEVQAATANPEVTAVETWMKAIEMGDYRAAKEFLQVRYADRWKGVDTKRIEIDIEMRQKIKLIAAQEGLDPAALEEAFLEVVVEATEEEESDVLALGTG